MTRKTTAKVHVWSVVTLSLTVLSILVALIVLAPLTAKSQPNAALAATTGQSTNASTLTTPLFQPVVLYNSGGYAVAVAVGDLNGDGKLDLAVANNYVSATDNRGTVAILLGNGDGTFRPPIIYPSGGIGPVSIQLADVNGDRKLDLLVANRGGSPDGSGSVGVLLGNGDGSFQPAVTYGPTGGPALALAVGDVNGDHRPDIAVESWVPGASEFVPGENLVGVMLGNGDGSFQPVMTYGSGGTVNLQYVLHGGIAIAELNGDGHPDLIAANGSGSAGVLLGKGDGTFQPAITYPSGGVANAVTISDLNGDRKPDLVVVNDATLVSSVGSVAVLLSKGRGTFRPQVSYDPGGSSPSAAVVADVNGDGKPDVLVSNFSGWLGVLPGNGDGTFGPTVSYFGAEASLAVGDLNGDGKPDVVTTCFGSVGVLLNQTPFDRTPPAITFSATPKTLWPPNGQMVPVTLSGRITDNGSGLVAGSVEYAVIDEYGEVQPFGKMALDAAGNYSFTILLRAGRRGNDLNGRQYLIRVSARDNAGNRRVRWQEVRVPHNH
jgi:hypothetical protein